MMKKPQIPALIVLVLYLAPIFQSFGAVGVYLGNLDYISSELCVNRDKPEMHCDGTCVLAQMMNKTTPAQQDPFENSENSFKLLETLAFIDALEEEFPSSPANDNIRGGFIYLSYKFQWSFELERPPEA